MAANKSLRTLITVVMDMLVVLAVVVLLRVVIEFFGMLSSADWGETGLRLTKVFVIPFGVDASTPINTPYGGIFAVDAVLTIVVFLAVEWVLSIVRKQV